MQKLVIIYLEKEHGYEGEKYIKITSDHTKEHLKQYLEDGWIVTSIVPVGADMVCQCGYFEM